MKCSLSPVVFSKVLAARKTNLITARARKKRRSARMLANTIRYPYQKMTLISMLMEIIQRQNAENPDKYSSKISKIQIPEFGTEGKSLQNNHSLFS